MISAAEFIRRAGPEHLAMLMRERYEWHCEACSAIESSLLVEPSPGATSVYDWCFHCDQDVYWDKVVLPGIEFDFAASCEW